MDLPDKDLKCHRAGFEKSCRQLVCDGACKRWVVLEGIENAKPFVRWDCIDNHAFTLQKITVFSIQSSAAAVESMRNEAKKAHDEQVTMAAIAVHEARKVVRDVLLLGEISPLPALTSDAPHEQ